MVLCDCVDNGGEDGGPDIASEAFALHGNVSLLGGVGDIDTGQIAHATGDNPNASVTSVDVPSLASAGLAESAVTPDSATTTITGLSIGIGGVLGISADTVSATVEDGTPSVTLVGLSVTVVGLEVDVPLDPGPNTTIELAIPNPVPGLPDVTIATLTLNEQATEGDEITVTAMRLTLLGGVAGALGEGDVRVAEATYRPAALGVLAVNCTEFLRTYNNDGTTTDTELDGVTPYTPRGEVGACVDDCPTTVQLVRLCDLNPDVEPDEDGRRCAVPFLRRIVTNCRGETVSTSDVELDGVTPYSPVEVVDCGCCGGTPALVELEWPRTSVAPDPDFPDSVRHYVYTIENPRTGETAHIKLETNRDPGGACQPVPDDPDNPVFNNPTVYRLTLDDTARQMSTFRLDLIDFDTFEGITQLTPAPSRVEGDVTWDGGSTITANTSNITAYVYWDEPPTEISYRYGNTGGGNACTMVSFQGLTFEPEGCCGDCGSGGGGDVPLTTECGLTGVGTPEAPLAVNTGGGEWSWQCVETNGLPVYCGSDGALRVDPEKYHLIESVFEQNPQDILPGAEGSTTPIFDRTLTLVNPSSCREMQVDLKVQLDALQMVMSPGNDWSIRWGFAYTVDGSDPDEPELIGSWHRYRHSPLASGSVVNRYPIMDASFAPYVPITLPPGGVLNARVRVGVTWTQVNPDTPEENYPTLLQIETFALYAEGWSL